jgi:hypothetical protein
VSKISSGYKAIKASLQFVSCETKQNKTKNTEPYKDNKEINYFYRNFKNLLTTFEVYLPKLYPSDSHTNVE